MAVLDPPPSPEPMPVAALFAEHSGWLQGWLRRRLGCPHQAADLTQDTFVRVLSAAQPLQLREPRAFLTVLAQRVLISFWRRRDLEQAYLEALAAQPVPLAPSPEEFLLVREAVEALDRLLDGLAPKVRLAFLMNRLEERTHVQIADALSVSVATVERYVKQAWLHCLAAQQSADRWQ